MITSRINVSAKGGTNGVKVGQSILIGHMQN